MTDAHLAMQPSCDLKTYFKSYSNISPHKLKVHTQKYNKSFTGPGGRRALKKRVTGVTEKYLKFI